MRLLLSLIILSSLTGCAVFRSKAEKKLRSEGTFHEVKIRKSGFRKWTSTLDGAGEGEISKGKLQLSSDGNMGVWRSWDAHTSARVWYSRALVDGDSCFAIFGYEKHKRTSYNSKFQQEILDRDKNEFTTRSYSAISDFGFTRSLTGYYRYLFKEPPFEPNFSRKTVNRVFLYAGQELVGIIFLKSRKNKVLLKNSATSDDRRYVLGYALSVKRKALRIPK